MTKINIHLTIRDGKFVSLTDDEYATREFLRAKLYELLLNRRVNYQLPSVEQTSRLDLTA